MIELITFWLMSAPVTRRQNHCLARSDLGIDLRQDMNFKFFPGTIIRWYNGAEPQTLTFVALYWVKSQIPSQFICYEGIFTVDDDSSDGWDVKPDSPLGVFR